MQQSYFQLQLTFIIKIFIMISSDSDQQQTQHKNNQYINVYKYIPKAKPVIDQKIQIIESNLNIKILDYRDIFNKSIHNGYLFKQNAGFQQGYMFTSNFESGNIKEVRESSNSTYYLKLRVDTNSQYQSQWFNFKVKGIKKSTFIIHGFRKNDSLFNYGMKVCIKQNREWKRGGTEIKYFEISENNYALKFQYTFTKPDQITQFAYCFPYTYTSFNRYLAHILKKYASLIKTEIITRTFLDNQIDCLTIAQQPNKQIILIMSRVHPGQTVSSFVLKGLLDYLLSDQQMSKLLRKYYQIKIIPILNPDGVKVGNYRYSYAGRDLNRCWKYPNVKITPEIYYTKAFIEKFQRRICMVIDLHGHSRRKNVFFYGCSEHYYDKNTRRFPFMMSQISDYFSYAKSYFGIQRQKQGTARITLWQMLRIPLIYTMQTSFCGNENSQQNYKIDDFLKIGQKLGQGISLYFNNKQQNEKSHLVSLRIFHNFEKQMSIFKSVQNQIQAVSEQNPSQGKYEDNQVLQLIQNLKKQKKIITLQEKPKNPIYNSQNKILRHTNLNNIINKNRSRINSIHKRSNQFINVDKDQFQQRKNLFSRQRATSSQISANTATMNSSTIINQRESFHSFYSTIKNPKIVKDSAAKISTSKFIKKNKDEITSISSIVIDDQFLRKGNFGTQYIKQKNYYARLMKQKPRLLPQNNSINESTTNYPLAKKHQKKFTIKPMKTINYNSWRQENIFQRKYLNLNHD